MEKFGFSIKKKKKDVKLFSWGEDPNSWKAVKLRVGGHALSETLGSVGIAQLGKAAAFPQEHGARGSCQRGAAHRFSTRRDSEDVSFSYFISRFVILCWRYLQFTPALGR